MNRKERFAALKAKETELVANLAEHDYNVELTSEDFKDNHLVASGYLKIKDSIISSNLDQKLVIEVPRENSENFKSDLEHNVALELKSLQNERKKLNFQSLFLLVVGIGWFIATQFLRKYQIINEIIVITTWVFIWAAVEKFFFERAAQRAPRYRLLMLLDAEIRIKEN